MTRDGRRHEGAAERRDPNLEAGMRRMMVRYTVKPGFGDQNAENIERVFAELAAEGTPGVRYASFRLDDGLSFVHLVSHEGAEGSDSLKELPAFRAFVASLGDRCEAPPVRTALEEVGSYRFFGA
jgi:hypothetical protein